MSDPNANIFDDVPSDLDAHKDAIDLEELNQLEAKVKALLPDPIAAAKLYENIKAAIEEGLTLGEIFDIIFTALRAFAGN